MNDVSDNTENSVTDQMGQSESVTATPTTRSARVVLPPTEVVQSDGDSDGEHDYGEGDGADEDDTEEDFLADWPDETEDLELINSRITSLSPLRLGRFGAHLRRLCVRQNLITHLDPDVFALLVKLEELDLYDNKIKKGVGEALGRLSTLTVLDLSFNLLKAVPEGLNKLKALRTIYFVQNRISRISGLQFLTNLRSLELGGNRLRKIEKLDALVNLEELWLGKNKITTLENLGTLRRLKILAMQSNRVTTLEGLEGLQSLEELYLSHNGIRRIEGLERNVKLKTLDLGNNFIAELENISHLTELVELWISGNEISTLRDLESQLGSLEHMETLYLEGNPCQTDDMAGYRRKVMLALPRLIQIDATYTRA